MQSDQVFALETKKDKNCSFFLCARLYLHTSAFIFREKDHVKALPSHLVKLWSQLGLDRNAIYVYNGISSILFKIGHFSASLA